MKRWILKMTIGVALAGGLLTAGGGVNLGLGVPTSIARGMVVGLVIYMLLALIGLLLGHHTPPQRLDDTPLEADGPPERRSPAVGP